MARILLIEDDADLVESLCLFLNRENFETVSSHSGYEGLTRALESPPDLILLDLNLPDLDGLSICKELRASKGTCDLPIIMLTARAEEYDRILGLDLGADDYITKPFSARELLSRIRALLRRRQLDGGIPEERFQDQRLQIDGSARQILLDGRVIRSTHREFDLLWFLIVNRSRVVSRERILERIWGLSSEIETRTIDVHIRSLRKKLGSEIIETVIGTGYRFRGYP